MKTFKKLKIVIANISTKQSPYDWLHENVLLSKNDCVLLCFAVIDVQNMLFFLIDDTAYYKIHLWRFEHLWSNRTHFCRYYLFQVFNVGISSLVDLPGHFNSPLWPIHLLGNTLFEYSPIGIPQYSGANPDETIKKNVVNLHKMD